MQNFMMDHGMIILTLDCEQEKNHGCGFLDATGVSLVNFGFWGGEGNSEL
jgi:hypothetical protein